MKIIKFIKSIFLGKCKTNDLKSQEDNKEQQLEFQSLSRLSKSSSSWIQEKYCQPEFVTVHTLYGIILVPSYTHQKEALEKLYDKRADSPPKWLLKYSHLH